MILHRIHLSAILLLTLSLGIGGQESLKAVLVDEFGSIGCEDLSGRLDAFIAELRAKPGSYGYIVISSAATVDPRLAWREKFIDGYPQYRGFDENRFILIRGTLHDDIQTQFWLAPMGIHLPVKDAHERRFEFTAEARKLKLYSDSNDAGPCYTRPPFRMLSKYLKANPDVNANIAIGSPSSKSFRKAKEEIIGLFTNDYTAASSRLRFFRAYSQYELTYELWLIRRKPK